ncbi:hypothetical protein MRB53_029595 [Persea americana]|uniref:Uncharacterized protein n=1 Tax=Persea americana TaxID=3435 RepID=A0ACC2KJ58_PERAE|nr:hypothetical protein MRB53_029595 [Persea americana]
MEGIFEVMGCTEHQKAILAAFKLEGDAKEWWKTAKRPFNGQETEITWAFFKREFIKKFIPDHIRAQKKREFETLVQGNLTVAKYALMFTELSHFVETLVATEEEKMERFVNGLRFDIKKDVKLHEPKTNAEALRTMFVSEEAIEDIKIETQMMSTESKADNLKHQSPIRNRKQELNQSAITVGDPMIPINAGRNLECALAVERRAIR